MPLLVDVTGPDYWESVPWFFVWNNDRWETQKNESAKISLNKKVDAYYASAFWDVLGDAEVYEIRLELFNQDGWGGAPCSALHMTDATPVDVTNTSYGSVAVAFTKTASSIVMVPTSTLLASELLSIAPLMVGAYYWGACGQSYISSVKLLIEGEEESSGFWQSLVRTSETV